MSSKRFSVRTARPVTVAVRSGVCATSERSGRSAERLLVAMVLGAMLLLPAGVGAARVAGQNFSERIRVSDTDLHLNGVGVRSVAMFKGYAAALYVPERSSIPATVLAQTGPRRLQLVMLMQASSQEFSKAVRGGIQKNSSPAEWQALLPAIDAFCQQVDALGTLKKGDVVLVDFAPASGVSLVFNGRSESIAMSAPSDFFRGILKIFVGDKPVDERLKAGILGK